MPVSVTSSGNQKEDELVSASLREERALASLTPELMQNIVEALASPDEAVCKSRLQNSFINSKHL